MFCLKNLLGPETVTQRLARECEALSLIPGSKKKKKDEIKSKKPLPNSRLQAYKIVLLRYCLGYSVTQICGSNYGSVISDDLGEVAQLLQALVSSSVTTGSPCVGFG